MEIKRFDAANEMLLACGEWLELDAAVNNLLLGTLYDLCALENAGEDFEAEMILVSHQNEDKVACLKVPSRELMISVSPGDFGISLEFAAAYFMRNFPDLNGVVGPEPMNSAFAFATNKKYRLGFAQRILSTTAVSFPKASPGRFRLAAPNEIDLLAQWFQAFFAESLEKEISIENAKARAQKKIDNASLWVWENESIVSMACSLRPTRNGITIGMVFTPQNLRNSGYASNTVAFLTQEMLKNGKTYCCLHTDAANPASNKIYEAIGYQEVGKGSLLLFE